MTKGVWKLQEVHSQILIDGGWKCYNFACDPGTLWAWGYNINGGVGDNTTVHRSDPVQIPGTEWSQVSLANDANIHSGALKTNNTLWIWGGNTIGELGDGTRITRSSPTQLPGTWCVFRAGFSTSHALKTDGTLWSWGRANNGHLGEVNMVHRSSPVQIPGTAWVDVRSDRSGGQGGTIALKTDGTLWVWGYNFNGELGANDRVSRSSPVQIPGSWASIFGPFTVLKSDGTLWTTGRGSGDGTAISRSSPVQVPGTNWVNASQSRFSRNGGAVKSNGTLWTWGYNADGQQGIDTTVSTSSPAQVPGTGWVCMFTGCQGHIALKKDYTLWKTGHVGLENFGTAASSPVQIPGTWIEAVSNSVSAGQGQIIARKGL